MKRQRVLFVCIHNSARSQMAEAYLKHFAEDRFDAFSGGLEQGGLNPFVVRAMAEDGIDISQNISKTVHTFLGQEFDYVIAVCDKKAADMCPVVPVKGEKLHWSFEDPSSFQGTEEEKYNFAKKVRDSIKERIKDWIKS